MMIQEFKNIKSDQKELKEFGLTMAAALSAVELLLFWKKGEFSVFIAVLAAMFFVLSFIGHRFLKPLHKIWIMFSIILGKISNTIILTFLFYFVLLPIGSIVRLLKGDFFGLKFNKKVTTYWKTKTKITADDKEYYEKQF